MSLEVTYDNVMFISLSGDSSGGHSCSQNANSTLPHLGHCVVSKLHILEWPFIVPNTRGTYVMILLFNQLLDNPSTCQVWHILAKGKCSLTGM
jgi:hypothetical protein